MKGLELKRISDLTELMKWRKEVIENVFDMEPSSSILKANREYYEKHISDGSHIAFLAIFNGEEIGSGSLCLTDELPSPDNPSGKCAYLMNIYVRKNFREHGVGHSIVRKLLETARNMGCGKIYLETTSEGRNVYESLGFHDMPDMMKFNIEK